MKKQKYKEIEIEIIGYPMKSCIDNWCQFKIHKIHNLNEQGGKNGNKNTRSQHKTN